MKKTLLILAIAFSFAASAQSWTPINGRQRFINGLGLPVKSFSSVSGADSAQFWLNPSDSSLWYAYLGVAQKVGRTTDTAIMLLPYLRKSDTSFMLSGYGRYGQLVKYIDTAAEAARHFTGGILQANSFPALTGDITTPSGSVATTLKNVGTPGTYGSVSAVPVFVTDYAGRVISVTNTAINIVESQVTNLTADLASKANLSGATFTGPIILNADPTTALGAATKNYVDNLVTGLSWKQAVRAATTVNITLSGTQTIDGIALSANDRVLVKNQTTASQNGLYLVAAGAWARTSDASTGSQILGSAVYIQAGGTANGGTQYTNGNTTAPVIGTDNITYQQIAGAGVYTNGTGITLTGNVFSLDQAFAKGLFSAGTGLSYSNGVYTNTGVLSFSGGTTGLTPSTATTGAVTLAGTLAIANGGTGQTTASAGFNALSPMTTAGDIIYGGTAGAGTRLAAGTATQVLHGGTVPSWSAVSLAADVTGLLPNANLANSQVTINGTAVSLGGSITVTATASQPLTIGTGLSGGSYNGSTAVTIANTGVLSITGTTNQITASASTGAITLSIPSAFIAPGSITATTNLSATENSNVSTGVALYLKRASDTGPLGYLIQSQNAAATANLFTVDVAGNVIATQYTGNLANTLTFGAGLTAGSYNNSAAATISIATGGVTNAMLSGSIDLTTKVTGILPIANGGTGSATQNFVDLTTAQTIAGVKTFSSTISGSINGNAATVTNGVYTTSSFNLGTTSIALNRASAAQTLTGISIDGTAGSETLATVAGRNNVFNGNIALNSSALALGSSYRGVQLGQGAFISGGNGSTHEVNLTSNLYFGSNWTVAADATYKPTLLQIFDGGIQLYNAAAGTVGSTATLASVFNISSTGTVTTGIWNAQAVTSTLFTGPATGLTGTAASLTAGNSTLWNNQTYAGVYSSGAVSYIMGYNGTSGTWQAMSGGVIQTAIGGPFLPLSGGTVSGASLFSVNSNSNWALQVTNAGTTGANGLYVNIGASSTGVPFRVDQNGVSLYTLDNAGNNTWRGSGTFGTSLTAGAASFTTGAFSGLINSTVGNNNAILQSTSASTGYSYINILNTSGWLRLGVENSTGGALATGTLAYSSSIGSATSTAFHLYTNNIVRQTIDASGNVGIGTTSPTALLNAIGSQPAAVATSGTAATQVLGITGGKGGNTTGTTGQAGGAGAGVNITAGAGGDAPAGSTNGTGGSIILTSGAAGAGAGTAGVAGTISLQIGGVNALVANANQTTTFSNTLNISAGGANITGAVGITGNITQNGSLSSGAISGTTLTANSMAAMGTNTKYFTMYDLQAGGILKYETITTVQNDLGLGSAAYTASTAYQPVENQRLSTTNGVVFNAVTAGSYTVSGGTATQALMGTGILKTLTDGTYTPTFTAVQNCSAFTAHVSQYLRVGNTITVSGEVDFTVTANTQVIFTATLPAMGVNNFANGYQLGGAGVHWGAVDGSIAYQIFSTSGAQTARFTTSALGGTSHSMWFQFTYQIP